MATEIRYMNTAGGGFNGKRTIEDGTTIERFFAEAMPGEDRARYNVRVNNAVPVEGQALRGGDLVSIIPGKYDGGAFGSQFIQNLQEAARLGAVVRETPTLIDDLKKVNELGTALRAIPNLSANVNAVIEFVRAVAVLDDGATAPAPSTQHATGIDPVEFARLKDAVGESNAILTEINALGGWAAVKARLSDAEVSRNQGEPTPRVVREKEIDTTPLQPGCVRLVTGNGLGRNEPIAAGERIDAFFGRIKPASRPETYRIEVNGSTVEADHVLKEGDSVLIRDINKVGGMLARGSSAL